MRDERVWGWLGRSTVQYLVDIARDVGDVLGGDVLLHVLQVSALHGLVEGLKVKAQTCSRSDITLRDVDGHSRLLTRLLLTKADVASATASAAAFLLASSISAVMAASLLLSAEAAVQMKSAIVLPVCSACSEIGWRCYASEEMRQYLGHDLHVDVRLRQQELHHLHVPFPRCVDQGVQAVLVSKASQRYGSGAQALHLRCPRR